MPAATTPHLRDHQRGATLVVALVILVLIMMLGITAVSTSTTQLRLAANLQFEDGAMNNAEAAVTAAESWLSAAGNYRHPSFSDAGYADTTTRQAHLLPTSLSLDPLAMAWSDANSLQVAGETQRYLIQQRSANRRLDGSSQVVGSRSSSGCNQVNTYQITARGQSARGATRYVQSYYSVLSCP